MNQSRKRAFLTMMELDEKLSAYDDFHHDRLVTVTSEDGNYYSIRSGLIIDLGPYFSVHQEHGEPMLFHKEEAYAEEWLLNHKLGEEGDL